MDAELCLTPHCYSQWFQSSSELRFSCAQLLFLSIVAIGELDDGGDLTVGNWTENSIWFSLTFLGVVKFLLTLVSITLPVRVH